MTHRRTESHAGTATLVRSGWKALKRTTCEIRAHHGGNAAMRYRVKEIFYTLQGEGANTGRPAVFCRFSGCNLWTGREESRSDAICQFCDTDFVGIDGEGGGEFSNASELADAVSSYWPHDELKERFGFV